jgi:5-dehydro-2-deoxygluconokinase
VVLGLGAQEEQLAKAFRAAARWPVVKGFAVGRTIFGAVAEEWFSGRLDDEAAVATMAARFAAVLESWERAKEES